MIRQSHELDTIAAQVFREFRAAPGASVAVAVRNDTGWDIGVGAGGQLSPGQGMVTTETPYDLASLTKPFTALTLARLVQDGLLRWDTSACVPLQETIRTPSSEVSLELLAAHRAGLKGHLPLYAPLQYGRKVHRYDAFQQAARARNSNCAGTPPAQGFPPEYSDLGYLLLGEALARSAGMPLDELVEQQISVPLGLSSVNSARKWRDQQGEAFVQRVAPTERVAWRGGLVRGLVHDENAFALQQDGLCGHAGLFGVAGDVALLGAAVLDALDGRRDDWLQAAFLEPLVKERPGGTLRAGFDGKSAVGSTAGELCGTRTFGHLGFTGTSMWLDPDAQIVTVLLTNRVHPTRDNVEIRKTRPAIHDKLFAWGTERGR